MQPAISQLVPGSARPAGLRRSALAASAARVLAVWSAVAVAAAAQFVAEAAFLRRGWTAGDMLARLSILPLWALATPFVLRSGRRWRIAAPSAFRNGLLHLAFGSAFLLAANLATHLAMLRAGADLVALLRSALADFLHYYPGGIAVYAAIVVLGGRRSVDGGARVPRVADAVGPDDDEAEETSPPVDRRAAPASFPEVVPVRTALRTHLVAAGEIDWIEGDGDHVVIHRGAEGLRTRTTLKSLAATLDPARFVRVHRSAVVRLAAVREIQPYFHGDFVVILHSGATIRLARSRRRDVETLLGNRL
jgi:DNA-binding LytR/AlgR family response regulator